MSEQVQTVRVRLDDGRVVTVRRATAEETTAALYWLIERGAPVAGAWQGVLMADGDVLLVPVSAVVESLRAVGP